MFKVNNRYNGMTSLILFWYLYCQLRAYSTHCSFFFSLLTLNKWMFAGYGGIHLQLLLAIPHNRSKSGPQVRKKNTPLLFTYSTSTIETPEVCVKHVRVNNKDTRMTSTASTTMLIIVNSNRFPTLFWYFHWYFEQVNATSWVCVGKSLPKVTKWPSV